MAAALAAACVALYLAPRVEADLRSAVDAALDGTDGVAAAVSGLTVSLSGSAQDEAARDELVARVRAATGAPGPIIGGAGHVDASRVAVAPAAPAAARAEDFAEGAQDASGSASRNGTQVLANDYPETISMTAANDLPAIPKTTGEHAIALAAAGMGAPGLKPGLPAPDGYADSGHSDAGPSDQARGADAGDDADGLSPRLKPEPDYGHIASQCRDAFAAVGDPSIVDFIQGSSRPTPSSIPYLEATAAVLRRCGRVRVIVIGHTDSSGRDEINQRLSLRRARNIQAIIEGFGVGDASIASAGRGASMPIADNATAIGRARNRRIEFSFAPAGGSEGAANQ